MDNRLRALREEAGMTQVDLALRLGVSRSTVIRWESGETKPFEYHTGKLCELFQVSVDTLGFIAEKAEELEKRLSPEPPVSRVEHPSTYFVEDRSNREEVERLHIQDRMITTLVGTSLPAPDVKRVLDVGCGTGGWIREVAKVYPEVTSLVGVDISAAMLEFARSQAQKQQVDDRVEYRVMDALRMLEFPDRSFDLVCQRYGMSFLRTWDWSKLLQEYRRVTQRFIQVTESELLIESSSEAYSQWWGVTLKAFEAAGHIPSVDTSTGDWLEALFEQHGLRNVKRQRHQITYSGGTPTGSAFVQDVQYAMRTLERFVDKWMPAPEYRVLCERVREDLEGNFQVTIPVNSIRGERFSL